MSVSFEFTRHQISPKQPHTVKCHSGGSERVRAWPGCPDMSTSYILHLPCQMSATKAPDANSYRRPPPFRPEPKSVHGGIEPNHVSFKDSCPIPTVASKEGGSDAESTHGKGRIRQEQCAQRPKSHAHTGRVAPRRRGAGQARLVGVQHSAVVFVRAVFLVGLAS